MQCITTPRFSLLVNGSPKGCFNVQRGLRQGDPISPYLFILSMRVLCKMFQKAKTPKLINGLKLAKDSSPLNHLMFTDNLMIMIKANRKGCHKLQKYSGYVLPHKWRRN